MGPDDMAGMEHGTRGRWHYEVVARTTAAPLTVWPLVGEAARWKDWSFLTRASLLRPGPVDPDGVGALRRLAVGPFGSCEEVVLFEPPEHLGYVARKGLTVRSYRADIVLRTAGVGTAITWTGSLETGTVTERGAHEDLMARKGPYAALVEA